MKKLRRNGATIQTGNILDRSMSRGTGIKMEEVREQPYLGEKREKRHSDSWDLVGHPSSLSSESSHYVRSIYRETSCEIQKILNNAFNSYKGGTIAILAIGMELSDLKHDLEKLTLPVKDRQWGDRREKIAILKFYQLSEHIFDNNEERRMDLIHFLEARIKYVEELIIDTAKTYGIQIPIKREEQIYTQGAFSMDSENFTSSSAF